MLYGTGEGTGQNPVRKSKEGVGLKESVNSESAGYEERAGGCG